jgi:hypothetical protein
MTQDIKLSKKIQRLRNELAQEVSSSTIDLINELVNAEIELEALCNQ